MYNLSIFKFESKEIRSVVVDGEPWFVGKDVALALGYVDPTNAVKQHCRGVAKHHPIVDSIGRTQEARILSEPDVLRLIVGSQLPAAQEFEAWVFEEVLPSIRKTGKYAAPVIQPMPAISKNQDDIAAIMMIGTAMASWPGVRQSIVHSATLNTIELVTGYPTESFRLALPVLESTDVVGSMNPTAIGKRIGKGAAWVNNGLRNAGLQVKNDRDEWVLTDAGHKYAESLPYTKNGHSGFQILWRESVIDLFQLI